MFALKKLSGIKLLASGAGSSVPTAIEQHFGGGAAKPNFLNAVAVGVANRCGTELAAAVLDLHRGFGCVLALPQHDLVVFQFELTFSGFERGPVHDGRFIQVYAEGVGRTGQSKCGEECETGHKLSMHAIWM